jgi:hypothetical protein
MVPTLKISSISAKENISSTYLISITSLLKDEQTSKHGGGVRYNAILEFKGSKEKNFDEKEKMRKIKKEQKYEYEKKRRKEKI